MECDYYIVVNLVVECHNNDKTDLHFIEYEVFNMCYLFIYGYDPDNNNYEYLMMRETESMIETYSQMNHTLYENKTWLIQNEDMINDYNNHLRIYGIKLDNVIKIEKKHYYQNK